MPISKADRHRFHKRVLDPTTEIYRRADRLYDTLCHIVCDQVVPFFEDIQPNSGTADRRLRTIHMRPGTTGTPPPAADEPSPGDPQRAINELAAELQTIIEMCHDAAMMVCTTKITNPVGKHYDNRRTTDRKHKLRSALALARAIIPLSRTNDVAGADTVEALLAQLPTRPPAATPSAINTLTKHLQPAHSTPTHLPAPAISHWQATRSGCHTACGPSRSQHTRARPPDAH